MDMKKFIHDIRNLKPLTPERINSFKQLSPSEMMEIIILYDSILASLIDIINKE